MTTLFGESQSAVLSDCKQYRYSLTRCWDQDKPGIVWIMLNPSVADASLDDPTIRRVIRFSQAWGFGSLEVVNLFAYRATNPADMFSAAFPIGEENDRHIKAALKRASTCIVAWGAQGGYLRRDVEVLRILADPMCLEVTKEGHPKHPLYCRADLIPIRYRKETTL
jgi:hypothetical protein